MISVRLEGRLGNQLFQYAFIYAASKQLGKGFYLDKSTSPFLLPNYFNIEGDIFEQLDNRVFAISGFKNLFTYYLRRSFYYGLRKLLLLNDIHFSDTEPPTRELLKLKDRAIYYGYFQSEAYFITAAAALKKCFTVRSEYQENYLAFAQKIGKHEQTVVIHVRRGDYETLALTLPVAYYERAIDKIRDPGNFYIVISDDPDYAAGLFGTLENTCISHEADIIDFQCMVNADTCILSNSSFSWWGAWLNNREATILAPANWSGPADGPEHPYGILPEHWTLIDPH